MKQNESGKKFEIDFEALKKLVDLVQSSKIGRIKVSCDGFDIEVENARQSGVVCGLSAQGKNVVCAENVVEDLAVKGGSDGFEEEGNLVSSPIVGTFYASPAPGKPAFVEVGSNVKKGDVLYIVESMKLMNEVKSDFDGKVVKIFVESGDPVEYGQPIMVIK